VRLHAAILWHGARACKFMGCDGPRRKAKKELVGQIPADGSSKAHRTVYNNTPSKSEGRGQQEWEGSWLGRCFRGTLLRIHACARQQVPIDYAKGLHILGHATKEMPNGGGRWEQQTNSSNFSRMSACRPGTGWVNRRNGCASLLSTAGVRLQLYKRDTVSCAAILARK